MEENSTTIIGTTCKSFASSAWRPVVDPDSAPGECRLAGCCAPVDRRGVCKTAYDRLRKRGQVAEFGGPDGRAEGRQDKVTPAMAEHAWNLWGHYGTQERAVANSDLTPRQIGHRVKVYRRLHGLPQDSRPAPVPVPANPKEQQLDHLLACLESEQRRGNHKSADSIRQTMHAIERELYGWGLE